MNNLKAELIENIKSSRKRYGRNSKQTLKAIYTSVKEFPYYDGYSEYWFKNNKHKFN